MQVVAIPMCDRKASSQMIGLKSAATLDGDIRLYINVETELSPKDFDVAYAPMIDFLENSCKVPWDVDVWTWHSSWRIKPQFDQDQKRLAPIIVARNMAIDYALNMPADHLFFVDADVEVPSDGLQTLLSDKHPVVCGMVPGRGTMGNGIWYIFGPNGGIGPLPSNLQIMECDFSTCGCMLIEQKVYASQRFRWGDSRRTGEGGMSEDPAFCEDAFLNGFGRTWVDTRVICNHWDDPDNPLTAEGWCNAIPYEHPSSPYYWKL